MSLGFNVVLALFILAPGFGVLAGIYTASQPRNFRPSPPVPNSVLGLAIVACGALAAHALAAAVLFAAQSLWSAGGAFNPNPYLALFNAREQIVRPGEIAFYLALLFGLTVAAYTVARVEIQRDAGRGRYRKLLYGWLADIVDEASGPNRYVSAFVLTDMVREIDGAYLGYEGLLENLTVGADKQVISVVVTEANTFYVTLGDKVERKDATKERPIARIHFSADQIKNLAFQVFEVVEEAAS